MDCIYGKSSIWSWSLTCRGFVWCSMHLYARGVGGGGLLSPKSYVDVPAGPQKSDFLYTNILPNFPPISKPFLKEKHPILTTLGAFYTNLPKIHPVYVICALSSLMKNPRSLYQISWKSPPPPKGRHIYVYHVKVRIPPGYTHDFAMLLGFLYVWLGIVNFWFTSWKELKFKPSVCADDVVTQCCDLILWYELNKK